MCRHCWGLWALGSAPLQQQQLDAQGEAVPHSRSTLCSSAPAPALPLCHPASVHSLSLQQAVYTALKETETRATDLLPYWKLPLVNLFVPRQQKAAAAVQLIRCAAERGAGVGWVG
jgi:hypothetical protein